PDYPNSFTGAAAVNYLMALEPTLTRVEVIRLFHLLVMRSSICACIDPNLPFSDDDTLYCFSDDFDMPRILQSTDAYSLISLHHVDNQLAGNNTLFPCQFCAPNTPGVSIHNLAPDLMFIHSLPQFEPSAISELQLLGSGSFGSVYQATFNSLKVVLKKVQSSSIGFSSLDYSKLRQECWVLDRSASSPFTISLIGVAFIDNSLNLMIELMNQGDLSRYFILSFLSPLNLLCLISFLPCLFIFFIMTVSFKEPPRMMSSPKPDWDWGWILLAVFDSCTICPLHLFIMISKAL
ncbi:MAG: protein kinase, partial [archaeon]|nr:protein kinase [archaeon]